MTIAVDLGRKTTKQTNKQCYQLCAADDLTLKAPITSKFVLFCCLLKCFRSLSNKQCRLRLLLWEQSDLGAHCLSLWLALLNNVSKNLQQTTSFRMIFAGVLRVRQTIFSDAFLQAH